jgi:NAD(P)-dependent dehydrogenase (short-subunit alcohol dehydrogenase family)
MKFDISTTSLKNKVIIVSGAANGIGAAVAKSYAQLGATVILLDKKIKEMEEVYDQIIDNDGPTPAIYPIDFKGASATDYQNLVQTVQDTFGQLDGLVHCAASLGQITPTEHQDVTTWLETLHINLTAPYLLTKSCLPLLKKAANSAIIFTTDNNKDKAYWSAYGIAKSSTEGLAKQLADELEAGATVRVNTIDPGKVKTNLLARAFPGLDPSALPEAKDITSPYVYLMSDESKSINGRLILAQDDCQTTAT